MPSAERHRITEILGEIERGEVASSEELLPLVYRELRALAGARMANERPGQTLQPTALVHEVYLRLLGDGPGSWSNRAHFFAAAAEAMRRILIEQARSKARIKRGGEYQRTTLHPNIGVENTEPGELLDLDQALRRLGQLDSTMAQVVTLRYFGGFTVPETAKILGTSERNVNRQWTAARAWLLAELSR